MRKGGETICRFHSMGGTQGTQTNSDRIMKITFGDGIKLVSGRETYFEVGCEWVWKSHVSGECRQDQIPHLDTVGGNDVCKDIVVVTQELWEVMKQHQQHSQGSLDITTMGVLVELT